MKIVAIASCVLSTFCIGSEKYATPIIVNNTDANILIQLKIRGTKTNGMLNSEWNHCSEELRIEPGTQLSIMVPLALHNTVYSHKESHLCIQKSSEKNPVTFLLFDMRNTKDWQTNNFTISVIKFKDGSLGLNTKIEPLASNTNQ